MTNKFLSVVMMFPLYTSAAIDISNNVTVSDGNSLPVALDVCNPITAQIPGGWLGFKLSTRSPDKCVTSSSGVSSISWNETGEPPRISFTNGMQLLVNESYLPQSADCTWSGGAGPNGAVITASGFYKSSATKYESNNPSPLPYDSWNIQKQGVITLSLPSPYASVDPTGTLTLTCTQAVENRNNAVVHHPTETMTFEFRPKNTPLLQLDETVQNLTADSTGKFHNTFRVKTDSWAGMLSFQSSYELRLSNKLGTAWTINIPGTGASRELIYDLNYEGTTKTPGNLVVTMNIMRTYT
ncbi:TPA: hypothetical protein IBF34_005127 [Escherichia coli]|uniref:hypothetical protein n=1 Tax=Escherichia coli TaxID=562 RepID=UPI0010F6B483|nr:hypothetical protein [Escherichia coli]EKH5948176.1 hypothetical protein [Escherichia coli O103]EET6376553.1 hypothetical protein [Escherichia coli]EEX9999257.1 hypothetical protein [Escherichia coli]EGX9962979.1 hypothetical protein [Escherichia coli]EKZ8015524.1 hypothetical protein [Escherichia coli]